MKKLLITFIIFIFCQTCALAETIVVQALDDISTENPANSVTLKVLTNIKFDENFSLKSGDIVKGDIINVTDPQRLKRDATFSYKINSVLVSHKWIPVDGDYVGAYTTKLNKADIAKSAVLSVGSYFVKGLPLGYYAVEGAVKNENDKMLESSAKNVYENSPLSYVEKGEELYIKKGELFYLKFKINKNTNEDEIPKTDNEE